MEMNKREVGRWKMEDGRWKMEDGWKMEDLRRVAGSTGAKRLKQEKQTFCASEYPNSCGRRTLLSQQSAQKI
jgi:hypothetical protein